MEAVLAWALSEVTAKMFFGNTNRNSSLTDGIQGIGHEESGAHSEEALPLNATGHSWA